MRGAKHGAVPEGGYPFVLTASRAEMSDYGLDAFKAFVCTFPHKLFPKGTLKKWFEPAVGPDGSSECALYGLRKVESIMIEEFGADKVVTTHPDTLGDVIGPNTKLIMISSMDPMGLAYVSTTYNSLIGFGGAALNASEFERLMTDPVLSNSRAKIVVGGEGVWQIKEAKAQDRFGIDVLFHGEAETKLVPLVRDMMAGREVDRMFYSGRSDLDDIRPIRNPSTFGMVEITRGCGRGCQFCSPTMRKRLSIPIEDIMREVDLNIKRGGKMAFLATEDFFLYKCGPRFDANEKALYKLFKTITSHPGLEYVQISHAALAPAVKKPKILERISPMLLEKTRWTPDYFKYYGERFVAVEVGVETGSTRLMEKYMKGKSLPLDVKDWPDIVARGVGNFNDHKWRPLCTLMTGLPGETERDLNDTLDLIDSLKGTKSFLTPLLFIPIEYAILGHENRVDLSTISETQWQFISRCWEHNQRIWYPNPRGKMLFKTINSLAHFYHMHLKPKLPGRKGRGGVEPPGGMVGIKVGMECDPMICAGGEEPGVKVREARTHDGEEIKERWA